MFYKRPRHPSIAKIVRIDTPKAARTAAKKLLSMAKKAKSRERKLVIKRSMVLAANRAKAMLKRRNLSKKERKELREVARIYRSAYKKI